MIYLHVHTGDAFEEEKHPRGEGGKFTSGGGSAKKPEEESHKTDVKAPRRVVNEYGNNEFENYGRSVEDVPIAWLKKLEGNALRKSIDWVYDLGKDIEKNGLKSPLIINVGKDSRTAKLGEGNHRLRAMMMMGFTHAPARVVVGHEWGKGLSQPQGMDGDIIPQSGKYFKEDASPSEVFRSLRKMEDKKVTHDRTTDHRRARGYRRVSRRRVPTRR